MDEVQGRVSARALRVLGGHNYSADFVASVIQIWFCKPVKRGRGQFEVAVVRRVVVCKSQSTPHMQLPACICSSGEHFHFLWPGPHNCYATLQGEGGGVPEPPKTWLVGTRPTCLVASHNTL